MKGWIALLIIVLVGGLVYFTPPLRVAAVGAMSFSPCDTPLPYKIGTIDPNFGLNQNDVEADIKQATSIWSTSYKKQLFSESPKSTLTVNFVYDKRSALDSSINQAQSQVSQNSSELNAKINQYEADVTAFKAKLAAFNAEVQKYNSEGGAPPDAYQRLKTEQSELQQEGDALNARARDLKLQTNDFNSTVNNLNRSVDQFNNEIAQQPEEGLYNGQNNTITIYFVDSHDEVVHTLAHEFGHALGMEHVQGSDSIMYPYTSSSITPTQQDLDELTLVCQKQNIAYAGLRNFGTWIINTVQSFTSKSSASS